MKEAIVSPGPSVEIRDSPIPQPGPDDVVVKVVVAGSNPKDWKVPEWMNKVHNSGDDVAGVVHAVGKNVLGFREGDRVAGFHRMRTDHGAFAEYTVVPSSTTFHIPQSTSYEAGAAIPLAAFTAACGLFIRLGLPEPWKNGAEDGLANKQENKTASRSGPVVIYGAASAVGAYALQLAKRAGIGPLICVAGRGIPFVEGFLDKSNGDVVVDYRKGDDAVVAGIKAALTEGEGLRYAFDAVSEKGSYVNLSKVLSKNGGKITLVLPGRDYSEIPQGIEMSTTMVGDVHSAQTDFGQVWSALFTKGLQEGWLKAHPQTVIPGGLNGVQEGLENLKAGKASATKYVFRIADTPGL